MLKMNNLSVEEVAQRRAELRKMRELAFRTELKARRANKIKSKTYRKLKRKEKERLAEKIDEEGEDDPESQMKQELERARERATLRHKHTGKWARQMRHKEGLDENSRRDIEEMLERGEKLRRRIKGIDSDDEEEESEDDDDDEGMDIEAGIEKIKQSAFDELRKLDDEAEEGEGTNKKKSKSVFEMKFMKDATARKSTAARKDVDDFIKEMGGTIGGGDDSGEEEEIQDQDPSMGVLASRTGGRVVFRPAAAAVRIFFLSSVRFFHADQEHRTAEPASELLTSYSRIRHLKRHSQIDRPPLASTSLTSNQQTFRAFQGPA